MKYIENFKDLEFGSYYHCVTYDDEDIIVQFRGLHYVYMFSTDLGESDIRYVLEKVDDLRERRKKFE